MLRLRSYDDAWGKVADEAAAALARRDSTWIPSIDGLDAPVAANIVARSPGAVVVEALSPAEVDAPLHLLVQLARAFGTDLEAPGHTTSDAAAIARTAATAESIAARATSDGRALVLVLPDTWPRDAWSSRPLGDDAGPEVRWRHLHAAVQALRDARLPIVVVSGGDAAHPWRSAQRCLYRRVDVGATDLESLVPAVNAAVTAARVALDAAGRTVTAADARALVGLVALGEDLDELPTIPGALTRRLIDALADDRDTADTLRCLALWRQGALGDGLLAHLPSALAAALVANDGTGRPSASVRRALRDRLRPDARRPWLRPDRDADEAAHARLANAHRQLDGATSPATLAASAAVAWLEKVHHLANAGRPADTEWQQQEILSREQYWDRARHLSRVQRRFDDAAALYRDCLTRFGPDSYTHHYLAYNLDRARASLPEVRSHYEAAVALWSDNPWWNTRLVTFLIGHGTLREAHAAFTAALDQIDPDCERMSASPWLALHLHRWVIRRWLALGYVAEARDVLDQVPGVWREQEPELRMVEHLVRDAEEALELGESVYPAGTPVEERWVPRVTPDTNGHGSRRTRWWPGRVLAGRPDGVDFVAADPQTRMAYRATVTGSEWCEMADQLPERARGFIEVAEYADGARLARAVPTAVGASLAREEADVLERLQA